ncbi:GTP-binding protein [Escherichia coli]|uniref:GTP-binding protein n=1 Tax=Escherichia coli TaxID=562 RepID=UPI00388D9EEA
MNVQNRTLTSVLSATLTMVKTTLTAAITTVLAKTYGGAARAFDQIDNARRKKKSSWYHHQHFSLAIRHPTRHYAHVDCPGHADYVKT